MEVYRQSYVLNLVHYNSIKLSNIFGQTRIDIGYHDCKERSKTNIETTHTQHSEIYRSGQKFLLGQYVEHMLLKENKFKN